MTDQFFSLIDLPTHRDSRGSLLSLDFAALPFVPARSFIITPAKSEIVRGGHAHTDTHQLLICLVGRVLVDLVSPCGLHETTFELQENEQALWIKPRVWAQQTYPLRQSRLMVFASSVFDAETYIHEKPKRSVQKEPS